jgi:tRNA pseudouridine55 synthase
VEVDRAARPIRVARFELLELALPRARFAVSCSTGTYVRALVRDVGDALGTGATLTALRRTRVGAFRVTDAIPLASVAPGVPVIAPAAAIAHLPAIPLGAAQAAQVTHGRPLALPERGPDPATGPFRLLAPSGTLLAVAEQNAGKWRYLRVFRG